MIKVFQTIVDKGRGNCMQAAIASLFEKELKEVPNFIEFGDKWWEVLIKFYADNGYKNVTPFNPFKKGKELEPYINDLLKHDNGVNGYFYATVPSQTFSDTSHAVIVDTELRIVHDPNPNQLAFNLSPEDVIQVDTVKDDWYINTKGEFVIGNWRNEGR